MSCSESCNNYETYKLELEDLVASWFAKDNIDSFLMPTYLHVPNSNSSLPTTSRQSSTNATIESLATLAAYSSYPSLNIPIGYTHKGLPVGILLLSKPETLVKSLNAAKLLESQYAEIKLPRTTPELNNSRFIKSELLNYYFFILFQFYYLFIACY